MALNQKANYRTKSNCHGNDRIICLGQQGIGRYCSGEFAGLPCIANSGGQGARYRPGPPTGVPSRRGKRSWSTDPGTDQGAFRSILNRTFRHRQSPGIACLHLCRCGLRLACRACIHFYEYTVGSSQSNGSKKSSKLNRSTLQFDLSAQRSALRLRPWLNDDGRCPIIGQVGGRQRGQFFDGHRGIIVLKASCPFELLRVPLRSGHHAV